MITNLLLGITLATGQASSEPAPAANVLVTQAAKSGNPPAVSLTTPRTNAAAGASTSTPPGDNSADKCAGGTDDKTKEDKAREENPDEGGCFPWRLYKAYCDEFKPKKEDAAESPPATRRAALPSPWSSPPFPTSEYQGPTIGVPPSDSVYPLMKALLRRPAGR